MPVHPRVAAGRDRGGGHAESMPYLAVFFRVLFAVRLRAPAFAGFRRVAAAGFFALLRPTASERLASSAAIRSDGASRFSALGAVIVLPLRFLSMTAISRSR